MRGVTFEASMSPARIEIWSEFASSGSQTSAVDGDRQGDAAILPLQALQGCGTGVITLCSRQRYMLYNLSHI